ncbi:MAG: hypothetical protein ABI846_08765 [Rudaea sp.]
MNTKHLVSRQPLLLASACVLACAAATPVRAFNWQADSNGLEGTWQTQVALHDCQSGAAIGVPFYSLLTFADGGTLVETTANALFFPAIRGPGHGVWSRTQHKRQFQAASLAFVTMNGALVKTQKISQTIVLEPGGDGFTTPKADIQFFDPAGNLVATGCATAVGVRFDP